MCAQHIKFLARTVLVKNNEVETAYRALDRAPKNDDVKRFNLVMFSDEVGGSSNGDSSFIVDSCLQQQQQWLFRILRNDMVMERARRGMYNEKPFQYRKRVSLEKCRRIYNSEMARKIEFVMRTNRTTPWPR